MRTKTKIKLLLILAIVLVVMCIFSRNTVSAVEYSEEGKFCVFSIHSTTNDNIDNLGQGVATYQELGCMLEDITDGYYFKLNTQINLGKSFSLDGLGKFTLSKTYNSTDDEDKSTYYEYNSEVKKSSDIQNKEQKFEYDLKDIDTQEIQHFVLELKFRSLTETRDVSFVTDNFNLKGNTTTKSVWSINTNYNEGFDYITNQLLIRNIDQKSLNEYSSSEQQVNITVTMEVPENTIKVTSDNKQFDIKTINGKKYIEIEETLNYTNTELSKPVKDDVEYIKIGEKDIYDENTQFMYINVYSSETEYKKYQVNNYISAYSINEPYSYSVSVVNKYGQDYGCIGGYGGYIFFDKVYLESELTVEDTGWYFVQMPENINFKETYFQLNIDVFQGDTIEVENLGTLYYAGISTLDVYKSYEGTKNVNSYIYKNSLDNLKQPTSENALKLNLKTSSNYLLERYCRVEYDISSEYKEETVTGTIDITDNKLGANVLFSVSGNGNAKLDTIEIPKSDNLYNKLENGLDDVIDTNKYNTINLAVYDIQVVEGSYSGSLNLTFDVGTENNGKECIISHLKNGLEYEYFKVIVENGKVTITVDSLSPFMVSLLEEKEITNTDNESVIDNTTNSTDNENKLDETPKTGTTVITESILFISLISLVGIVILKKNNK